LAIGRGTWEELAEKVESEETGAQGRHLRPTSDGHDSMVRGISRLEQRALSFVFSENEENRP
jgi:hypothetical protein